MSRPREGTTVLAGFLVFASQFFDRLAPLYLVVLIRQDLAVSAGSEGTLALFVGLGWAGSMILSRWTSSRWSIRSRIVVSAVGGAVFGAVSVLAPTWMTFIILRGLGGLSGGAAAPAITALTFAAAPPSRRGFDLGLVQSASRVGGSLLSPVVVTAIAMTAGWRAGLLASASAIVLSSVILAVLVAPPAQTVRRRTSVESTYYAGGKRNVVVCTVLSMVSMGWLVVISQSGIPLLAHWRGLGPDAAGRVLSWFGVTAAVAALLVPTVSDVTGRGFAVRAAAIIGGSGGLAIALASSRGAGNLLLASALLATAGVAMGVQPLALSIIPAEAVSSGDVGRAVVPPIMGAEVVGGGVMPFIAFALAPMMGLPLVVATFAAVVLMTAGISTLLHEDPRDHSVGDHPLL